MYVLNRPRDSPLGKHSPVIRHHADLRSTGIFAVVLGYDIPRLQTSRLSRGEQMRNSPSYSSELRTTSVSLGIPFFHVPSPSVFR